jgi:hypothetical protein
MPPYIPTNGASGHNCLNSGKSVDARMRGCRGAPVPATWHSCPLQRQNGSAARDYSGALRRVPARGRPSNAFTRRSIAFICTARRSTRSSRSSRLALDRSCAGDTVSGGSLRPVAKNQAVTPSTLASLSPIMKLALFVCPDSICRIAPSVTPTACASALGESRRRVRNERRRSPKESATREVYAGTSVVWYCVTRESMLPGRGCVSRIAPNAVISSLSTPRPDVRIGNPVRASPVRACAVVRATRPCCDVVASVSALRTACDDAAGAPSAVPASPRERYSPTPRGRPAASHDHKSRVRNDATPAASTATVQAHAHHRIATGGADVTANGLTPVPLPLMLAAAAVNAAGCNA